MKWTSEGISKLRELAFAEKSNAEIAAALHKTLADVYAERSRLGITHAKVDAAKGKEPAPAITPQQGGEAQSTLNRDLDRKRDVLDLLAPALGKADNSIIAMELTEQGKFVKIHYSDGARRKACIECDSLLAMIADVVHKCLY